MFGLFRTSRRSHSQALKEHAISLIIATMPIWANALVAPIVASRARAKASPSDEMLLGLFSSLQGGSLLLLSTALMGPIIYLAVGKDLPEYSKSFPSTFFHISGIVILSLVATLCYGALVASGDPAQAWLITLSGVIFALALFLSYSASVFDNERTDPAGLQSKQDKSFESEYAAHRALRRTK